MNCEHDIYHNSPFCYLNQSSTIPANFFKVKASKHLSTDARIRQLTAP